MTSPPAGNGHGGSRSLVAPLQRLGVGIRWLSSIPVIGSDSPSASVREVKGVAKDRVSRARIGGAVSGEGIMSPCGYQCMPYCAQSYGGGFRHRRPSDFLNRHGPCARLSAKHPWPDRTPASRTRTLPLSSTFFHALRPRRRRTCLHFQASIGMAIMRSPTSRSTPSCSAFTSPRSRTPSRKLRSFSDSSKRNASPSLH